METERYFLLETADPDMYPMVNMRRNKSSRLLSLPNKLREYDIFELEFSKYCSAKSQMGDYHYNRHLLLSERTVDILKVMNLYMIDYLDAELIDKKGNTNYDYNILHIRNHIECFDREHSAWSPPAFDANEVLTIDMLTLDGDKLFEIPLEKRLLFKLKECTNYTLFHESVVDAITAIDPTNIRFVSVEAWHSNIGWEI